MSHIAVCRTTIDKMPSNVAGGLHVYVSPLLASVYFSSKYVTKLIKIGLNQSTPHG